MSSPDERTAYALATWARFDQTVSEELLSALCGAFAVVAVADGELARSEVDGFLDVLKTKSDVFSGLDFARLESAFRDLTEALFSDPIEGKRRALDLVAGVRRNPQWRELVHTAARIATEADERVRPPEEAAISEIREALGLDR